jgi:hypothetical protein
MPSEGVGVKVGAGVGVDVRVGATVGLNVAVDVAGGVAVAASGAAMEHPAKRNSVKIASVLAAARGL